MSKIGIPRGEADTANILGKKGTRRRHNAQEGDRGITPAHAHQIFERKVLDIVNNELDAKNKEIIPSDGTVRFDWVVDEEMPQGSFAIIQDGIYTEQPEEYVLETDQVTGEIYKQKKLPDDFKPYEKMHRFYYLKTDVVKDVFDKLDPDVKENLLDAWRENLDASNGLITKYRRELEEEVVVEKKDLEAKIVELELVVEKIKRELGALE